MKTYKLWITWPTMMKNRLCFNGKWEITDQWFDNSVMAHLCIGLLNLISEGRLLADRFRNPAETPVSLLLDLGLSMAYAVQLEGMSVVVQATPFSEYPSSPADHEVKSFGTQVSVAHNYSSIRHLLALLKLLFSLYDKKPFEFGRRREQLTATQSRSENPVHSSTPT